MAYDTDQKTFCGMIMLVALATCFKSAEDFLTEDQILSRGYAPIAVYGKSCISRLIDCGLVEFKVREPLFPDSRTDQILFIKRPGAINDSLEDFIYNKSQYIRDLLKKIPDCNLYLKTFSYEIISCECIEYCEFYAKRSNFEILNCTHNNAKLRLLVLECSIDKIHMLLWKSIKTISNSLHYNDSGVEFSSIIDAAFESFINYKKLNATIESYNWPKSIRISVLSGMIELFRNE